MSPSPAQETKTVELNHQYEEAKHIKNAVTFHSQDSTKTHKEIKTLIQKLDRNDRNPRLSPVQIELIDESLQAILAFRTKHVDNSDAHILVPLGTKFAKLSGREQ